MEHHSFASFSFLFTPTDYFLSLGEIGPQIQTAALRAVLNEATEDICRGPPFTVTHVLKTSRKLIYLLI